MAKRKPLKCRKCKAILSVDGHIVPLVCPNCGADADEVDKSWLCSDPDDIDAPFGFGGGEPLRYVLRLCPKRARPFIVLAILILMGSYVLWLYLTR